MASPCGSGLHSVALLTLSDDELLFMYLWHTLCFLQENVYPDPIFKLDYFFAIELYEFFVHFGYKSLSGMICKYSLPFCRLPFILLMVSVAVQKLCSLVLLVYFLLSLLLFQCQI